MQSETENGQGGRGGKKSHPSKRGFRSDVDVMCGEGEEASEGLWSSGLMRDSLFLLIRNKFTMNSSYYSYPGTVLP